MTDERVRVSIEGGVADVRLARPEKLNALDPAMFDGRELGPKFKELRVHGRESEGRQIGSIEEHAELAAIL